MTRAGLPRRTAWLGAVALLLVAGYLLTRRRPVPAAIAGPAPVIALAPEPEPEPGREQSLPTWARVSIVVVTLLAFFAVSLIATKQV